MRGEYSLADIAAATGNGGNNGNGMFGENGAWWIIILILFFGYGRNGGFGGGSGSGAADNYVLASDFSQLSRQISDSTAMTERKLDSITNGLCDGFYTNAQLINGVNTNILTTSNAVQSQLAGCCCDLRQQVSDCCCKVERGIDGVNYNMATNTCAITNAITMNTRDIIDNQNANYRALHDEIIANRIEDKNAQITAQQNEINALRLAASQEKQNAYLLSELKPCPSAAYIVPNPNCCYNYQVTQGCGCGCGNY